MALGVAKLEKAYRRNPQAPLFAHLAEIYLKKGDVPRALTLCLSGCKLFPDYPTGHLILSRCYEVQGDLEDARKALLRGLLLDPLNPCGFGRLARLCHQLGDLPMALKSMQKAANLDAFSETAQEEVEALEEELRNHGDDNGSVVETVEEETVAVPSEPGSNPDQDSDLGSTNEAAEMETPSPVEEEASQVSQPEHHSQDDDSTQDEPFARVYAAPDLDAPSSQADDDPADSMKSADEIQDEIDAFFDTMGDGLAAPQETGAPDAADSSVGRQNLDVAGTDEEAPTSVEAGAQESPTDLVSLSAEPTDISSPDPASLEGSETLATLMAPTGAGDGEPPETTPHGDAESPADLSPSTNDDLGNDLLVLSAPSDENVVEPAPDEEQILEGGGADQPSAAEEGDQIVDSFITLSDASSSEPLPLSAEGEAIDLPADPMLFIDSNSTRPPESRVADLDGTAPAPSSPPDESEDLGLEGEDSEDGEIASLAPGEDRELTRLFQEIDDHGSEQSCSDEEASGEPAQNEGSIATATLAGIYLQQGLVGQALQIYKRLLEEEPENAEIRRKIQELNG